MMLSHSKMIKTIVCLFTIILCLIGGIYAIDPVTPYFPRQWNYPDRIMYPFPFEEPVQMKRIIIDMTLSHEGQDLFHMAMAECYLQFNGEEELYQMNVWFDTPHGHEIVLSQPKEVNHIDFTCYEVDLFRPRDHSESSSIINIVIALKADDHGVLASVNVDHLIEDQPLLTEEYMWDRITSNLIKVDLTFYIPYTLSDVMEYDIYHPLLDLNAINSMHKRGDNGDAHDEMEVPYNILGEFKNTIVPPIGCRDFTLGITYIQVDGKLIARLKTSDTGSKHHEGNFCVMSIEYPPETLDAIFKHTETTPYISTITSTHDQQLRTSTPVVKPSILYRRTENPSGLATMVALWASDFHSRDKFTEFEIGIATTHITKSHSSYLEVVDPPAALTFSVTVLGLPEGQQVHDIMEWEPVIACRQHHEREYPADAPVVDGLIELASRRFHGFGLTCRIRLTKIPSSLPTLAPLSITFIPSDPALDDPAPLDIGLQTGMDKTVKAPPFILHEVTTELDLPPMTRLLLSLVEENSRSFAVTKFNVQYLLTRPSSGIHLTGATPSLERHMALHLFFTDFETVSDFRSVYGTAFRITARPPGSNFMIRNRLRGNSDIAEYVSVYGSNFADIAHLEPDPLSTIFRAGFPVRCPTAIFRVNTVLDAARPLEFTIEIDLPEGIDNVEFPTAVYAALLPEMISQSHSYSPYYGYISPARYEPLEGYSYRCVTWDKLAAPYLYGGSSPLPLTDDNSFPCPSHISPTTGLVDVSDGTIWRRVEHTWTPTGDGSTGPACFYELSAVCVTPSATVPGAYDTHPVADCPSFLDEVHSVPCSMLMDPPVWGYSLSSLNILLGSDKTISDNFSLSWVYLGDPRLSLTIQIAASDGDQVPSSDDLSWIRLTSHAPAYISPVPLSEIWKGEQPVFAHSLPRFNRGLTHLHAKLTLNGFPDVEIVATTAYTPVDTFAKGCDDAHHKEFDSQTNLCGCKAGYLPNVDVGIDNPFIDPADFLCIPPCDSDAGETWNPETNQCEENDGNDEPTDSNPAIARHISGVFTSLLIIATMMVNIIAYVALY